MQFIIDVHVVWSSIEKPPENGSSLNNYYEGVMLCAILSTPIHNMNMLRIIIVYKLFLFEVLLANS